MKIMYYTPYADGGIINGYVNAKIEGTTAHITRRQYNRAFKNLTIGGVKPQFILPYGIRALYVDDELLVIQYDR